MVPIYYRPEIVFDGAESSAPEVWKAAALMEHLLSTWSDESSNTAPLFTVRDFSPATREDLYLVHDRSYVDRVLNGTSTSSSNYRTRALAYLNSIGSIVAALRDCRLARRTTCSLTAGFHQSSFALGPEHCPFNGFAVAAAKYLQTNSAHRVGILECDINYGRGTAEILGMYPELSAKVIHRSVVDMPEKVGGSASFFLWLKESIKDINSFGCDVVLYQASANMSLGHQRGGFLRTHEMTTRDVLVFDGIRGGIAWNLGGGSTQDFGGDIDSLLLQYERTFSATIKAKGGLDRNYFERNRDRFLSEE